MHERLRLPFVPFWRRWLGDEAICAIVVNGSADAATALFPEAEVTHRSDIPGNGKYARPMPDASPAPIK
jgi:hypothetical protein